MKKLFLTLSVLLLAVSDLSAIYVKQQGQSAAFGAGAVAGDLALYGPAGWTGGGAIVEGTKYSNKVSGQMDNLDDPLHSFPKSIDGYANEFGNQYIKMGNDGQLYQHLELYGNYAGKTGVFHYIKGPNGIINHRFFEINK